MNEHYTVRIHVVDPRHAVHRRLDVLYAIAALGAIHVVLCDPFPDVRDAVPVVEDEGEERAVFMVVHGHVGAVGVLGEDCRWVWLCGWAGKVREERERT